MKRWSILSAASCLILFLNGCATDDIDVGARDEPASLRSDEPIPGVDKPGASPSQARTTPGVNF